MDDHAWRLATVEDMIVKYCHIEYEEVIKRYRKISIANGWDRPWDGTDGADFQKWKNRLVATELGISGLSVEEAMEKLEQEDDDAKLDQV